MELIVIAALIFMCGYLWVRCLSSEIEELRERCRYLEHLVGGLMSRPDRLEGDEWKDGVQEDCDE